MKFYKTKANIEAPPKALWAVSGANASKDRGTMREQIKGVQGKFSDVETEEVEIEPNKAGLLAFLNGPHTK